MGGPEALLLGEAGDFNGHHVTRVGLAGAGAYLVNGDAFSLEGVGAAIASPPPPPASAPQLVFALHGREPPEGTTPRERYEAEILFDPIPAAPAAPRAPIVPVEAPAPSPRRARSRAASRTAARGAGTKMVPELLQEARDALHGTKGVSFTHRAFDGGEAVTVSISATATFCGSPCSAARVLAAYTGTGLHAEIGPDGASVVVAWKKSVLAGAAPNGGAKKR
jgi:hypothetical protein